MVDKVREVLYVMAQLGINLTLFLDAVSWGDPACTSDAKVRSARTGLMKSQELPSILQRWWKPPRTPGSSNARSAGASHVMTSFARQCYLTAVDLELEKMAALFKSPVGDDVAEDHLTAISFMGLIAEVKEKGPFLWSILHKLAYREDQLVRNTHKNADKIILMIISMLSYTRSHHRGRIQKLFAIYFKFRGLTAKGFDTLHALGLTMSHKWTCNAVGRISKSCTEEMLQLMDMYPWLLTYDNLNIPFRVFSQRLDNQGDFGSATAATVYIKRSAVPLSSNANWSLQETRAEGLKNPLTPLDILILSQKSYPRIHSHTKYQVLQVLLEASDFELPTYAHRGSALLQPPEPVHQLPCGKDHITLQFLLGTVNIPEASYEDNSRLIKEWLSQLKLDSPDMQKKLGLERLIAWVGDQLTVDRLRNLFKFRAEDLNSFDRLDWMMFTFGWFHLLMATANSFHKQYLGTARGRGLSQAFDVLMKKGLGSISTKGPFYHDLNEALYTVAAAHLRQDWLLVSKVQSVKELRQKSPEALIALADQIVEQCASSSALERMDAKPENQRDEVQRQTIMWNRDILQYIVLDQAVKNGDVGLMEDSLPHLLFRFIGGKNSNYAIEVLELLQALHREWPAEIKDFVRNHCWLANNSGKRDTFLPFDRAQEHNNLDIKVTHRSEGPSIDWEYLKKLHPAIHIIRAVGSHVEQDFRTITRGKNHATPKKELDILALQESYRQARVHVYEPGRKIRGKRDRAKDITTDGALSMMTGAAIARWVESRSFTRSTGQEWNITSDSDESDL
ncbi:hypothetical protein M378DRAFT_113742 [Amanita muscaria Koide BX008]|uniref:DUF6589 domain-containing protein n=1 Tax=Amanita muscaria (strain Koide BX008) TaxID=946122 RepID=A0A0C2W394_AMAMK|nr:hypothetical protein M378DRAFT_113742 [Amanita muscaria Koide BX008]